MIALIVGNNSDGNYFCYLIFPIEYYVQSGQKVLSTKLHFVCNSHKPCK